MGPLLPGRSAPSWSLLPHWVRCWGGRESRARGSLRSLQWGGVGENRTRVGRCRGLWALGVTAAGLLRPLPEGGAWDGAVRRGHSKGGAGAVELVPCQGSLEQSWGTMG